MVQATPAMIHTQVLHRPGLMLRIPEMRSEMAGVLLVLVPPVLLHTDLFLPRGPFLRLVLLFLHSFWPLPPILCKTTGVKTQNVFADFRCNTYISWKGQQYRISVRLFWTGSSISLWYKAAFKCRAIYIFQSKQQI